MKQPTCQHALTIGGVRFLLSATDPIINEALSPAYAAFLSPPACQTLLDLPVRVRATPDVGAPPGRQIFDSQSGWSMYADGAERFVVATPASSATPAWIARLSSRRDAVDIDCGPRFLRRTDSILEIINPLRYPLDQLLLMYVLVSAGGLLVHAAGLVLERRAFIFPGVSGAGKSTLSRCVDGRGDTRILSDDRVVLRASSGGYDAYGSPWPGELGVARNAGAPLEGIHFLEKSPMNRLLPLSATDGLRRLLPVASVPWFDRDELPAFLAAAERLVQLVPARVLAFAPGEDLCDFLRACA